MKNRFYLLFFFCILLFIRCEQEEIATPLPFSPGSAVEWYEANYPSAFRLKIAGEYVALEMSPCWESARFAENGRLTSLEAELLSNGSLLHLPGQHEGTETPSVRNVSSQLVYSLTRLILLTDEETGERICFLMVVVPTAEYYAQHPDFYEYFSYFDRSPDYSGRILYYNSDGEFVNGWEYEAGQINERITPAGGPLTRSGCSTVFLQVDI